MNRILTHDNVVDCIIVASCWTAAALAVTVSDYDPRLFADLAVGATFGIVYRKVLAWATSE